MTLSEFKAWFEGYTEGLEAAPTKAQFDRIKEKVKLIDGAPIIQTVWLNDYRRYYPAYVPYWGQPYVSGVGPAFAQGVGIGTANSQAAADYKVYTAKLASQNSVSNQLFDGQQAMYALGKAEAMN